MVENFGLYLKHERELRGVPLEEIAGATKIHIRFLKALEENHFEKLPGEVFIKGYIRSYARTIGSDVDEVLNTYDQMLKQNPPNSATLRPAGDVPEGGAGGGNLTGFIFFGILLAGLIVGGYFLINKIFSEGDVGDKKLTSSPAVIGQPVDSQGLAEKEFALDTEVTPELSKQDEVSPQAGENDPSQNTEIPARQIQSIMDSASTRAEDAGIASAPATVIEPGAGDRESPKQQSISQVEILEPPAVKDSSVGTQPGSLKLFIKARQDSWFNMTVDDSREEDFILPAGTSKTFYGNDNFRITIGNRTGTELVLNGKQLVLPQGQGEVVKDFIINHQKLE